MTWQELLSFAVAAVRSPTFSSDLVYTLSKVFLGSMTPGVVLKCTSVYCNDAMPSRFRLLSFEVAVSIFAMAALESE